ncbi:cytochrome P450 [Streptomyces huiliensis]|uniref:cytochrome P450 n=1 Tax=Streptomyces huiliensis TaxID=2876027 RepID=UPI001CBE57C2|nr:cytochrome P450 [Streptomyces huiliensis]MBZ4320500.1 cytochrome P450 [Streptomyces huiliensis]
MTSPVSPREIGVDPAAEALLASVVADAREGQYATYHRLRTMAPLLRTSNGTLVLTRYEDCATAIRHRDLGAARPTVWSTHGRAGASLHSLVGILPFSDPPDHTRLRRAVASAFTADAVERLRASVTRHAETCVAGLADHGDFMAAVARPLTLHVTAELLGVPAADRPFLATVAQAAAALVEPFTDEPTLARTAAAARELYAYFTDVLAEKRRHPAPDLLSRLESSRDESGLDTLEVVALAATLFVAGCNAAHMLGNGLRALLDTPAQFALLRRRPDLTASAVEEMLRYDPPVQVMARRARTALTLAGLEIEAGALVVAVLAAANRDPDRFTDPDRFDIIRDEGPHLSFAGGAHYCLGSQLARLQAEIVFSRLPAVWGRIEPAGPAVLRPESTMRRLQSLPVRVHAA